MCSLDRPCMSRDVINGEEDLEPKPREGSSSLVRPASKPQYQWGVGQRLCEEHPVYDLPLAEVEQEALSPVAANDHFPGGDA
jgi:hypothetical protein